MKAIEMDIKCFKTKTGYCYLRSSMIVLTRGNSRSTMVKLTQIMSLLMDGFQLVIGLLLLCYVCFFCAERFWLGAVAFALISGWLLYGSLPFFLGGYSATPIIRKGSIRKVRFYRGVKGITRSRFEITFENHNGKLRRRLIILPGNLSGAGRARGDEILHLMNEYFKQYE